MTTWASTATPPTCTFGSNCPVNAAAWQAAVEIRWTSAAVNAKVADWMRQLDQSVACV